MLFTKEDLKTGQMVLVRNGDKYIVLRDTEHGDILKREKGCVLLNTYNKDLICEVGERGELSPWDVVKVFTPLGVGHFLSFEKKDYELVWEREEPLEVTMKDIRNKFGREVKIVDSKE